MKNRIIAVLFIVILFATAISQKSYLHFGDMIQGMISSQELFHQEDEVRPKEMDVLMNTTISEIDTSVLDNLPYKTNLIRINGSFLKNVGVRSYYNNSLGLNITTTGYNIGRFDETSTDYEVEEMISLKKYLDEKGINLLYVSEPAKYISDDYYMSQFGGESYINRNTDRFLERIGEAGIEYLDLREEINKEGLDSMELFYRTDHHWTVPASEWAAFKIANRLNEDFNYNIDLSLYDINKFDIHEYKNCWLGEQGKKVSDSYIGLENYVTMEPKYETSFSIINDDGDIIIEGPFDIFINKSIYDNCEDYYDSPSWHYSYMAYYNNTIRNNNMNYGNVLVLGDSYETSMAPFLALGINDLKVLDPRGMETGIRDVIESGDYDTVIIAYAQFMIGAHDDEYNSNYRMFMFD